METQIIEKAKKRSYKRISYSMFIFVFCQVMWYMTFSEPLTVLIPGGEPIFQILSDDIISRTARLVMIYHSLAIPFLVANTFWILEHYSVRERWVPTLKVLLLPGAYMVGIFGMLFAYTRIRLFHEFFYFGMFLCFIGGIVFVISAFPIAGKFPDPDTIREETTFRGMSLEYLNLVVLAVCILISTIYGAISALETFTGTIWGLGREPIAFLAEAIVRQEHDIAQELIVSHLHIQLAQSAAMVVMVGFRTSKLSGYLYQAFLILFPIGIITLSYGAWVLNHYIIWIGAGILILVTIIMSFVGMKNVIKDKLGERYSSASRFEKIKSLLKNPVRFAYYYLFAVSQLLVLPQVYVGLTTEEVYRLHTYVPLEYGFNVGHWHMLSVMIATLLMLHAIDNFNVEGLVRKILGWTFFIGLNFTFIGGMFYQIRPLEATGDLTLMYVAFVGVWFLVAGFIIGIYALGKALQKSRRDLKSAYVVIPGEQSKEIRE